MKNIYIYSLCIIGTLICVSGYAQERFNADKLGKFDVRLSGGITIGGSAPMNFPAEIRKINSYEPAVPFFAEVQTVYYLNSSWGVGAAVNYTGQGMSTSATVKGYQTTFNDSEDASQNVRGYFYGDIATNVKNTYVQVPVTAHFALGKKWELNAGPYVAFAVSRRFSGSAADGYFRNITPTGTKIQITDGRYDFRKDVRTFDWGGTIGGQFFMTDAVFFRGQFNYGAISMMKTSFESISFDL